MKKILLFTGVFFLTLAVSAQVSKNNLNIKNITHNQILEKIFPNDVYIPGNANYNNSTVFQRMSSIGEQIGETNYDLQSNSSVARRIINYGDGTLSAVWTTGSTGNDRGTGYNHFNGTTWFPVVSTRIENIRTGWPSIGLLGTGQEFVMAHDANVYGFQQGYNTIKGSNTWTFTASGASKPIPPSTQGTIWGRMGIGGPDSLTIHLVSNAADTLIKVNGVKSPFLYSRSLDGGLTWDKQVVPLPGYDSTRTLRGSADDYAIDVAGNTVAIVQGGLGEDVTLWKSIDNGNTFTKTYIDSFPYAPDFGTGDPLDTVPTNDGSVTVLLDQAGNAHVAYGYTELSRSIDPATGDTGTYFSPGLIGLIYWNEMDDTLVSVPVSTTDVDADGDGEYAIGTNTTQTTYARYGNNALLNKPSIATDADGNIFIIYSLPQDADSTGDGQSFRDIWVSATPDNGGTWTKAQNLTKTFAKEEAFASVAKLADDFIHIVYQEDEEPGTELTNADPTTLNLIKYLKVSTDSILAQTAAQLIPAFTSTVIGPGKYQFNASSSQGAVTYQWDFGDNTSPSTVSTNTFINHTYTTSGTFRVCLTVTGYGETATTCNDITVTGVGVNDNIIEGNINVHPNPTVGAAKVKVANSVSKDANVKIYNILGEKVKEANYTLNQSNEISLDLNDQPNGIYFVKIQIADKVITKKLTLSRN